MEYPYQPGKLLWVFSLADAIAADHALEIAAGFYPGRTGSLSTALSELLADCVEFWAANAARANLCDLSESDLAQLPCVIQVKPSTLSQAADVLRSSTGQSNDSRIPVAVEAFTRAVRAYRMSASAHTRLAAPGPADHEPGEMVVGSETLTPSVVFEARRFVLGLGESGTGKVGVREAA